MSIIMVDCEDCYARAARFQTISHDFSAYADKLGDQGGKLTEALRDYSRQFEAIHEDIVKATDIWTDFYVHNVRTD